MGPFSLVSMGDRTQGLSVSSTGAVLGQYWTQFHARPCATTVDDSTYMALESARQPGHFLVYSGTKLMLRAATQK